MANDQEKSKMGQILERLQEESWQLELLISGFAIFLVAGSGEMLWKFLNTLIVLDSGSDEMPYLASFVAVLMGSWIILLINLILHILLRGLWISAIGLRYISGDIDFSELNLAPRFEAF